jgi:hypothetical protein
MLAFLIRFRPAPDGGFFKKVVKITPVLTLMAVLLFACDKGDPDLPEEDPQVLPGQGIKEVKIGDTGQKAVDAFGAGVSNYIQENSTYLHYIIYADKGIQVNLEGSNSATLDLSKKITLLELFAPYAGQTAEKTGLGTAQADVRTVHGTPSVVDVFIPSDRYNSGIEFYYDATSLKTNRIIVFK